MADHPRRIPDVHDRVEHCGPFVAKVAPDAGTLLYSTLVGSGLTGGMVLNANNEVILAGIGGSLPVTTDAYSSVAGTSFIAKLSADAAQLPYATYFSTPKADTGGSITNIALDPAGDVWIAGNTQFTANVPVLDPLQSVPGTSGVSSGSAFVSEFDLQIHTLLFSTYFNGSLGGSRISGLALDTQGRAHITGTGQYDLPTTPSAYLGTVTPPPPNYTYTYGFAAVIDPAQPGPGVCFPNHGQAVAQVSSSSQVSLTVANCGNAPLNITSIQLTSPLFALASQNACVGALATSASCTIAVNFTPTAAGTFGATLVLDSNADIPVYNLAVSGYATAPLIVAQPSSLAFPAQVLGVGGSGASLAVFAENSGTAPLIVNSALTTISGDFSIVGNTCSSPVQVSSGCGFTMAFQPTALGTRTGTLTIVSNDPVRPSISVPLSGTALASYPSPTITSLLQPAIALGTTAATTLHVIGTNFFTTSYVTVDGEPLPTTYSGAGSLQVTLDPTLLTVVGELPVTVVNPSPGGQSPAVPLTVYQAIPVSAIALACSPTTQLLYAAVPATASANPNTIVSIDPLTGKAGTPIPVGNNPTQLTVSSDGNSLFVGLSGDHTLQRINLTTSLVKRTFSLPLDPAYGVTTVNDIHALPGSPQSVVASLYRVGVSPGEAGAALFNDSGLVSFLANTFQNRNDGIDDFTFTSDPTKIYSYPFGGSFFTVTGVSPTALTLPSTGTGSCCTQATRSIVASDGTLLYTNSGEVWNPATSTLLGTYVYPGSAVGLFYEPAVLPGATLGRTFFLDTFEDYNDTAGYTGILSFNQSVYSLAGSISIPVRSGGGTGLQRWGANGLAFSAYTDSSTDFVALLRSGIAHTATGGTPSLATLMPASVITGASTFQLTVNGSGFLAGSTVLWNGGARLTTYVSSTQLVALVPSSDLANAATAQITVTNPAPGGNSTALAFTIAGPGPTISPGGDREDIERLLSTARNKYFHLPLNFAMNACRGSRTAAPSQTKVILPGDGDLLFGAEIPFRFLDRAMPEQELDLFQVPAVLPAEFGTRPAQVMRAEAFDTNSFGRLFDDGPHGPVPQAFSNCLVALLHRAEALSLVESRRRHPGVDPLLHPQKHSHRADAAGIPAQIEVGR